MFKMIIPTEFREDRLLWENESRGINGVRIAYRMCKQNEKDQRSFLSTHLCKTSGRDTYWVFFHLRIYHTSWNFETLTEDEITIGDGENVYDSVGGVESQKQNNGLWAEGYTPRGCH